MGDQSVMSGSATSGTGGVLLRQPRLAQTVEIVVPVRKLLIADAFSIHRKTDGRVELANRCHFGPRLVQAAHLRIGGRQVPTRRNVCGKAIDSRSQGGNRLVVLPRTVARIT